VEPWVAKRGLAVDPVHDASKHGDGDLGRVAARDSPSGNQNTGNAAGALRLGTTQRHSGLGLEGYRALGLHSAGFMVMMCCQGQGFRVPGSYGKTLEQSSRV
jgi:hypothetical protein